MLRILARDALIGIALAVSVGTATTAVLSMHSIPARLQFWDADRNHFPDLVPEPVRVGGTGWWDNARQRVIGAVAEWDGDTAYNVFLQNAHSNYIFIDRGPLCDGSVWTPGTIGRACVYVSPNGTYDQIYDADAYLAVLDCSSCSWWGGASQPPAGSYDLGGYLTHELGHFVRLQDIGDAASCSSETAYQTMCGQFGPDGPPFPPSFDINDSYYYRTLTTHDAAAANEVYRQVYRCEPSEDRGVVAVPCHSAHRAASRHPRDHQACPLRRSHRSGQSARHCHHEVS